MVDWIESFGYLGAFLGAIMEGEVLFLTAVQMSRLGYMNFYGVLIAVFTGTLTADWLFYWSGRTQGRKWIEKNQKLRAKFERMDRRMERYDGFLLFAYRFMYGFRIVLPALFGVRGIPPWRFGLMCLLSTTVWVALFGTLGYYFADLVIEKVKGAQEYGWIGLVLVVLLVLYFTFGPISLKSNKED
ncbi:MAG: DedA family protein [Bacteroidota bacterium]